MAITDEVPVPVPAPVPKPSMRGLFHPVAFHLCTIVGFATHDSAVALAAT